jgi:hypothetical protein
VSGAKGTLFASQFSHLLLEHNREVIQGFFPVVNWHCPFFGGFAYRHKNQFDGRILVGINLPVPCEFADHALVSLPKVGRGTHW